MISVAERSVVARLRLEVGDYKRNAADAAKSTKAIGDAAEQVARQSTTATETQATGLAKVRESARQNEQAWNTVGTAVTGFGALVAGGLTLAVTKFADFDAQMSSVQAATHETTDNMEALRAAAMEAGADTAFSATEAAQGIEELAKAGVSTADILNGGLSGALDLAAAGGIGVAEAAETAASAMTQFKLAGDQTTHVADLLAAGAGKAQGGVHDLAMALNQSGLVAAQTGLTIEETTGALAMFASAGMVGSDAGTSFKTMLMALTPSSKEAQRAMDDLGISAYDAQGNFIGMEAFAGNLQTALADLTVEQQNATLKTIFGSDATRAAAIIFSEGAEGVREWQNAVDDAGYAAITAALMTDNLQGDVERLGGAFDTLMIRMGEGANAPLRGFVQDLESAVDWAGRLPQPILNAATGLGGVAAAAGLAAGGFLLVAPRVFDVVDGFKELNKSHPGVVSGVGKAAKAVGLLTAAFTAVHLISDFVQGLEDARYTAEELANVLNGLPESTDVIGDAFGDIFKPEDIARGEDFRNLLLDIADPSFVDSFNQWSAGILGMETGFGKTADRLREYGETLASVAKSDLPVATERFRAFWKEAGGDEAAGKALLTTMPAFRDALAGVANEMGIAADESNLLAIATRELTPEMEAAGVTTEQLQGATEAAQEAMAKWRETIADAAAAFGGANDAYQSVIDKNKELAEETAAATESSEDSWEDFYDGTTVSAADWIANLQEQAEAMAAWKENALEATAQIREQMPADMQAAADAMIDELVAAGPEGAAALATFTEMSAAEKVALIEAWQGTGSQIGNDLATELQAARAPVVVVEADIEPAMVQIGDTLAFADGATGTLTIDGNPVPAEATLATVLGQVGASVEAITINGEPLPAETTLGQLLSLVRNSEEPITIGGDNAEGAAALASLLALVSRSEEEIGVDADTAAATRTTNAWQPPAKTGTVNYKPVLEEWSPPRKIGYVDYKATSGLLNATGYGGFTGGAVHHGLIHHATGGAIHGPGTGTSDDVVASGPLGAGRYRLSNGEHIWTDAETKAVGGHGNMYRLRKAALAGELRSILGYAEGGAVEGRLHSASVSVTPVVNVPPVSMVAYVENPWTGEYMEARMVTVADSQIGKSETRKERVGRTTR